jgi:hypothetical protein
MDTYQATLGQLIMATEEATDFAQVLEDFAYQGFDPVKMAEVLQKQATTMGRPFHQDIRLLITLAVSRGTNIDKVMVKMSEVGKTKVEAMKIAYGIVASSKGMGQDGISLSRIVATFPQIAAYIIAMNPGSNHRLGQLNTNLPEYLSFPGANALIPLSGADAGFHIEYKKFADAFSELVGSTQTEKERDNFIAITKKSLITGDENNRKKLLKELAKKHASAKKKP